MADGGRRPERRALAVLSSRHGVGLAGERQVQQQTGCRRGGGYGHGGPGERAIQLSVGVVMLLEASSGKA